MRGFRYVFLVCILSFLSLSVAPQAHAQQHVALGNATAELTGPWKFHTGDNMAWAQPDFDDSAWGAMDLTPPPGSYDPVSGSSGFVPGWTARGYKGYSGYAWYRLRVNVQDGQSALALKMPDNFDDAYQVYVNGRLIGEFGRFTSHGVTYYDNQPRAFPMSRGIRSGPTTIAIRMWMDSVTPLLQQDAGGLHGPPTLGQPSVIHALEDMYWYGLDHRDSSVSLSIAVNLFALLIAFGLFWLDRSEPAYLWLGFQCTQSMLYPVLVLIASYTTWVSASARNLLLNAVLAPLGYGMAVIFWAYWFRTARMGRLHRAVWSIVALLVVATAMTLAPFYGSVVPVHANIWLAPLIEVFDALLALLLLWVTYQGIRKDRVEGLLALPAVLLVVVAWYGGNGLAALHVQTYFYLFGVIFPLGLIADYVALAIITVLMLRRFLHGQRAREQWKLEIEQARQVQQMLIPEALPVVPGFTIESEYRPAQRVGGDFFQIIPHSADGSILIVLGDVSGKGLKAAMLVSLIMGAIRMVAETTHEPMAILQALNRRLCRRMQGHFATCVVTHIAANGETTLVLQL
jgi:hypothetical protein